MLYFIIYLLPPNVSFILSLSISSTILLTIYDSLQSIYPLTNDPSLVSNLSSLTPIHIVPSSPASMLHNISLIPITSYLTLSLYPSILPSIPYHLY